MKKEIFNLFFLFFITIGTDACVCSDFQFMPKLTMEHILDTRLEFISAKVIHIKRASYTIHDTPKENESTKKTTIPYNEITVKVLKNYNGSFDETKIKIATGKNPFGDCGYPFKKGGEYLIALLEPNKSKNGLRRTSVCLPTNKLLDSFEAIQLLNQYFSK